MKNTGLLRIGEICERVGVSPTTVHYYVREGLLVPAKKTARNMAYYDEECVEDIRFIKELQAKRFLPLSVIKLLIQARRQGQPTAHRQEMGLLMDRIFQPLTGEGRRLSFEELKQTSGLDKAVLKSLESASLLMPAAAESGPVYDEVDLNVALIFKDLFVYGLKPDDLRLFTAYAGTLRNLAQTIHRRIHESGATDTIPADKVMTQLENLKSYLALKVYRQIALDPHNEEKS
jgi:DNA-binding transcriptional MerR regulator